MHRIFMVVFAVFFAVFLHGQDTLNHIDAGGRKQGFWRKSDTAGQKIYEGWFADGIPYGEFRYFYRDGKLKTTSFISRHGKHAVTVSYFPNGKKMAEGNYFNEKKDSLWRFYSEIDGLLVAEEFYKEGMIEGKSRVFYQEGTVSEVKTYLHGVAEGPWQQFFTDGKLKLQGNYKAGEKHGVFRTYFLSGLVRQSGHYSNGHQDGTWVYFDEEGATVKTEVYRNGRLLKTSEPQKN